MRHTSAVSAGPATTALWQVASDPSRAAALHGLVGEFCHLLRNRLNSLQMGLYLARHGCDSATRDAGVWDELDGHYRAAEKVVDLFQIICRPMTLTRIPVGLGLVLNEFSSRWAPRFAGRNTALVVDLADADGPSCLDPSRLAIGLDALASWRIDRAQPGRTIHLRGWVEQGRSRLEWSEADSLPDDGGALPLAALARVASAHGGSISEETRDGWSVRLDWPHGVSLVSA
ncbi:MAG: hypothetical protein JWN86_4249 [Planctomycetota bacterium]|nr:hypothetical protein [Planctomycetota bacterium]